VDNRLTQFQWQCDQRCVCVCAYLCQIFRVAAVCLYPSPSQQRLGAAVLRSHWLEQGGVVGWRATVASGLLLALFVVSPFLCCYTFLQHRQQRPFDHESSVDEERMRPGHWLQLLLCVPTSLQCFDTDGWVTARTSTPQTPIPLIPRGSVPEQVEEDLRWNLLS